MPNALSISKASPLSFVIQTGAGTINSGTVYDQNYLLEDIATGENCGCLVPHNSHNAQIYEVGDGVAGILLFEFLFEHATKDLVLYWADTDGNYVAELNYTQISGQVYLGQYGVSGMAAELQEACYQARISTLTWGANVFNCANSGDFESAFAGWGISVGGTNVLALELVIVHGGAQAAKVTTPGVVGEPERNLMTCGNLLALTEQFYRASIWVRQDSGAQVIGAGQTIQWDFSDWDHDIMFNGQQFGGALDDTWVEMVYIIRINTADSGNVKLQCSATVQANGNLYYDDITLTPVSTEVVEAISQTVSWQDSHDCSMFIGYYNDEEGFQIDYDTNTSLKVTTTHGIRIPGRKWQFRIEDQDYILQEESDGDFSVITARNRKIYTLRTELMPFHVLETLAHVIKHDVVEIDGLPVVFIGSEFPVEWGEYGSGADGQGMVSLEFTPKEYDYQNSNC